jgi:DNA processing protein
MDILAVPGPMGRAGSAGCNALIRDGAIIVLSPKDVLNALGLMPAATTSGAGPPPGLSDAARQVWTVLSPEPMQVDEIAVRSGLPAAAVTHLLLELELSGRIRQLAGSRFAAAMQ